MTETSNGYRAGKIIRTEREREYTPGLTVFPPGAKVKIAGADDAVVTAVTIGAAGVRYEVAWWNGNNRSTAWVEVFEVSAADGTQKVPLGFIG